jgi:hypothetical protein
MCVSNAPASLGAKGSGATFGELGITDGRRGLLYNGPLMLAASAIEQLARIRTGDHVLVADVTNLETVRASGLMGHEADEYIDDLIVGDRNLAVKNCDVRIENRNWCNYARRRRPGRDDFETFAGIERSDFTVHRCLHERQTQTMTTAPRSRRTTARPTQTLEAAHSGRGDFIPLILQRCARVGNCTEFAVGATRPQAGLPLLPEHATLRFGVHPHLAGPSHVCGYEGD